MPSRVAAQNSGRPITGPSEGFAPHGSSAAGGAVGASVVALPVPVAGARAAPRSQPATTSAANNQTISAERRRGMRLLLARREPRRAARPRPLLAAPPQLGGQLVVVGHPA